MLLHFKINGNTIKTIESNFIPRCGEVIHFDGNPQGLTVINVSYALNAEVLQSCSIYLMA